MWRFLLHQAPKLLIGQAATEAAVAEQLGAKHAPVL